MPFPLPGPQETYKAVDFQCLESLVCQSSIRQRNSRDVLPILGIQLPFFFRHAPCLVSLTVGRNLQYRHLQEFPFPWSQLTCLSLSEPISPKKWMEMLVECTSLKSGSFSLFGRAGHTIGTETASSTQTSLCNLRLSFMVFEGDAFQVLRTCIFENVAVLTIEYLQQSNLGEQYSLKSHFPSLDHLALRDYQLRSEKILPILLNNRDMSQISLEMDGPPGLQIPFFRLFSTRITHVDMPHLSKISIIASNDNGIKLDYIKAFSDMVRAWFNSSTSNGDIQAQGSYSIQLRILPTSVQFVPNFYKELEDCMERGLNLVVKADHVHLAPWL